MKIREILMTDVGSVVRKKGPAGVARVSSWRGPIYMPAFVCLFFGVLFPCLLPSLFPVLWWSEGFLFFRRRHVIYVLSTIEGLLRCNVPLPEGLRQASLDAPNHRIRSVLLALADDMNMGATLSEAMRPRTRFFPPGMAEYVRVAESAGDLPGTFAMLIEEEETTEVQSQYWRDWGVYYAMYALTALPVALFAVIRVLPEFRMIFEDFGVDWPPVLPWLPFEPLHVGIVVISLFSVVAIIYFFITLQSAVASCPRNVASGRLGIVLARLPFFRTLYYKQNLGAAARVAGKALAGGATLDEALKEASDAPIHPRFCHYFYVLGKHIETGLSFSEALDATQERLPGSFKNLLRVGERSGMLAEAFERIGFVYLSDVRRMTFMLVETIAPFGVLLFGALVLSLSFTLYGSLAVVADVMSQAV